jgi:hypothetical protein
VLGIETGERVTVPQAEGALAVVASVAVRVRSRVAVQDLLDAVVVVAIEAAELP